MASARLATTMWLARPDSVSVAGRSKHITSCRHRAAASRQGGKQGAGTARRGGHRTAKGDECANERHIDGDTPGVVSPAGPTKARKRAGKRPAGQTSCPGVQHDGVEVEAVEAFAALLLAVDAEAEVENQAVAEAYLLVGEAYGMAGLPPLPAPSLANGSGKKRGRRQTQPSASQLADRQIRGQIRLEVALAKVRATGANGTNITPGLSSSSCIHGTDDNAAGQATRLWYAAIKAGRERTIAALDLACSEVYPHLDGLQKWPFLGPYNGLACGDVLFFGTLETAGNNTLSIVLEDITANKCWHMFVKALLELVSLRAVLLSLPELVAMDALSDDGELNTRAPSQSAAVNGTAERTTGIRAPGSTKRDEDRPVRLAAPNGHVEESVNAVVQAPSSLAGVARGRSSRPRDEVNGSNRVSSSRQEPKLAIEQPEHAPWPEDGKDWRQRTSGLRLQRDAVEAPDSPRHVDTQLQRLHACTMSISNQVSCASWQAVGTPI